MNLRIGKFSSLKCRSARGGQTRPSDPRKLHRHRIVCLPRGAIRRRSFLSVRRRLSSGLSPVAAAGDREPLAVFIRRFVETRTRRGRAGKTNNRKGQNNEKRFHDILLLFYRGVRRRVGHPLLEVLLRDFLDTAPTAPSQHFLDFLRINSGFHKLFVDPHIRLNCLLLADHYS